MLSGHGLTAKRPAAVAPPPARPAGRGRTDKSGTTGAHNNSSHTGASMPSSGSISPRLAAQRLGPASRPHIPQDSSNTAQGIFEPLMDGSAILRIPPPSSLSTRRPAHARLARRAGRLVTRLRLRKSRGAHPARVHSFSGPSSGACAASACACGSSGWSLGGCRCAMGLTTRLGLLCGGGLCSRDAPPSERSPSCGGEAVRGRLGGPACGRDSRSVSASSP